jgi:hypothetical protein
MDGRNASDPIENQMMAVGSPHRRGTVDDTPGLNPLLPRVYIISETRLFREGLMAMVTREGGIEVVGHGPCPEALQEIGNLAPDVALLDMGGATAWSSRASSTLSSLLCGLSGAGAG